MLAISDGKVLAISDRKMKRQSAEKKRKMTTSHAQIAESQKMGLMMSRLNQIRIMILMKAMISIMGASKKW